MNFGSLEFSPSHQPNSLEGPRNMTVFIGNQCKSRLVNIILGHFLKLDKVWMPNIDSPVVVCFL